MRDADLNVQKKQEKVRQSKEKENGLAKSSIDRLTHVNHSFTHVSAPPLHQIASSAVVSSGASSKSGRGRGASASSQVANNDNKEIAKARSSPSTKTFSFEDFLKSKNAAK